MRATTRRLISATLDNAVMRGAWSMPQARLETLVRELATRRTIVLDEWKPEPYTADGGVRVIPVEGVITKPYADLIGMWLDEAVVETSVRGIVLEIDSPGGYVAGTPELSDQVYNARGSKPVIAYTGGLMTSAAYWIGSAADTTVAARLADVGSIGVWTIHADYSRLFEEAGIHITVLSAGKYKTIGNMFEPLTDEARAEIDRMLREVYDGFVGTVARNRGADVETVRNDMAEGRVFSGSQGVAVGLIDRLGTLEDAVRMAQGGSSADSPGRVERQKGGQNMATSFEDQVNLVLSGRGDEVEDQARRESIEQVVSMTRAHDAAQAPAPVETAAPEAPIVVEGEEAAHVEEAQEAPAEAASDNGRAAAIARAAGSLGLSAEAVARYVEADMSVEAALAAMIDEAAHTERPLTASESYRETPAGAEAEMDQRISDGFTAARKRLGVGR